MITLDKRDIRWQSSFRVLLAYGKQLNMLYFFQQVFNLIILICFIGINNRIIRKLISIILQGINIAKASMGQEAFHGLSILWHHQRDFQSIKKPFLAGLIASKMFIGVNLGASNPDMVTHGNRQAIN